MAPRKKRNAGLILNVANPSNGEGSSTPSTPTPTPRTTRRSLRLPSTSMTSTSINATKSTKLKTEAPSHDMDMDLNKSDGDFVQTTTPKQRCTDNSGAQKKAKSVKREEEHEEVKLEKVKEEEDQAELENYEASNDEDTFKSKDEDIGDDESDDEDWEEVEVSASVGQDLEEPDDDEEISGPWQYNAVEIVFDKPLQEIKKTPNRGVTKEERMIRVLIHQTHLLCLIASGLRRNRWISHPKLLSLGLSLVPSHIAGPVQARHDNPVREVNALNVLAIWWKDSFVVTGPGIQKQEYADVDVVGFERAMPAIIGESLKKRKNLQRKLLNRSGSSDVCAQLFTGICRSLGLKTRLVESLQACSFKVTIPKDDTDVGAKAESSDSASKQCNAVRKGKRKKIEEEIDESDTTRGSRVVIATPHRMLKKPSTKVPPNNKLADPPVFWTEVYSTLSRKWITIDAVRGVVNQPLKMHPASSCSSNVLSYVVAYDEDDYVTDVTRRYTSQWGGTTKRLRVQPAGAGGFDWWAQTMSLLMKPHLSADEELEQVELLQSEVSERMPTKLGDFNNHPLYALERHIKKFEVLHPHIPVLGHIRGEAIYPRSCVKQVRSKENWLKRARQLKPGELIPVKWVKKRKSSANEDDDVSVDQSGEGGEQVPLFGEWQTVPYEPPYVVDGKVPRNEYGRQDVFTPAMVPIGGTHLKGRNIARVARLLGVDFVEAVTGFEFQSRRSVPVIQGIIVPSECAELVMDGYHEISHHADQEARRKKKAEVLQRWRKLIKGAMVRARLLEEYGGMGEEDDKGWVPDDDSGTENGDRDGREGRGQGGEEQQASSVATRDDRQDNPDTTDTSMDVDSGGGFMLD
ncbi:hypothetical protein MVEG_00776 [Podila verticillata NRRL 6337]|nr:hypothetical protein MVEG_00776 [Podila verticillata NRRL 6337]